jgi:hypothetical protein
VYFQKELRLITAFSALLMLVACGSVAGGSRALGSLFSRGDTVQAGGASGAGDSGSAANGGGSGAVMTGSGDTAIPYSEALEPRDLRQTAWRGSADGIVGMSSREIETAFGSPSFIRSEAPAEVWQYRQANCIVDMFLYSGGAVSAYRVEHIEMRGLESDIVLSEGERGACFDALAGIG